MNYVYSTIQNECVGYMGDRELNDLMQDIAWLVHDREWCLSGDTCEETYLEAVQKFKQKWFSNNRTARLVQYINKTFDNARDECMAMIGVPCGDLDRYGSYVNKSAAARILGVTRPTVYVMIGDGRLQTDASGRLVSVQSITEYMTKRG